MTKAISLTHIELRGIGLEPEFELQTIGLEPELELQTIGNDVKIELNASTIAGQDDQPQRSAGPENESELLKTEEPKRTSDTKCPENSSNESELPKTEEAKRTSDTNYDKTEIIPLLQTDQIAEPGDTILI